MLEIETLIKESLGEAQKSIAQLPGTSEIPSQAIDSKIYENLNQATAEANKQGFHNFAKWLGQTLKEGQRNLA